MDDFKMEEKILEIVSLLKQIRDGQEKQFRLLNKYDDEYLSEIEKNTQMLNEG